MSFLRLSASPVNLSSGNPLMVSGIVVFYFEDTKKTAIEIQYPELFVSNAAQTSLKSVVGRYPYESDKPGQYAQFVFSILKIFRLCLKKSARQIGGDLTKALQDAVLSAGVRVISFDFNELSYAPGTRF